MKKVIALVLYLIVTASTSIFAEEVKILIPGGTKEEIQEIKHAKNLENTDYIHTVNDTRGDGLPYFGDLTNPEFMATIPDNFYDVVYFSFVPRKVCTTTLPLVVGKLKQSGIIIYASPEQAQARSFLENEGFFVEKPEFDQLLNTTLTSSQLRRLIDQYHLVTTSEHRIGKYKSSGIIGEPLKPFVLLAHKNPHSNISRFIHDSSALSGLLERTCRCEARLFKNFSALLSSLSLRIQTDAPENIDDTIDAWLTEEFAFSKPDQEALKLGSRNLVANNSHPENALNALNQYFPHFLDRRAESIVREIKESGHMKIPYRLLDQIHNPSIIRTKALSDFLIDSIEAIENSDDRRPLMQFIAAICERSNVELFPEAEMRLRNLVHHKNQVTAFYAANLAFAIYKEQSDDDIINSVLSRYDVAGDIMGINADFAEIHDPVKKVFPRLDAKTQDLVLSKLVTLWIRKSESVDRSILNQQQLSQIHYFCMPSALVALINRSNNHAKRAKLLDSLERIIKSQHYDDLLVAMGVLRSGGSVAHCTIL